MTKAPLFPAAAAVLAVLGALTLAPSPAAAAAKVGMVEKSQPDSFQAEGRVGHILNAFDPIYRNARIYTKAYGTVQIRLDDGSDVMITPNSSIVIDDYVYADGGGGAMGLSLVKGALRVISGRIPSAGYQVRTDVATIGVRGTRYWLDVDEPGILKIWIDEGAVVARPVNSGEDFVFTAPAYAECTPVTCAETPAPPQPVKFPTDPRQR